MPYYKVVQEDLTSLTFGPNRLKYKIGCWLSYNDIYVLDNHIEAQRLAGKRHLIYKCLVGNNVTKLDNSVCMQKMMPFGTCLTDKVYLIERVPR